MEDYLRVGVIASTHGVSGEVKVFPTTDDVSRFKTLKKCVLDTKKGYIELEVSHVKFFKQMAIIKFKSFNNINEVEGYKGCDLLVTRDQAVPLADNENFICDLIGLAVVTDEGEALGKLTDVIQTGANDVYVVTTPEKKEILLPVIPACILDVSIEKQTVTAHILPGLLDL